MTGAKLSGNDMHSPDIIERAFELARSAATIDDVRNALRREGYSSVDAHLAGPTIKADLRKRFVR
jgi:tRNA G26 N,N-dimethylase Trm1